jgi:hypothetical protein
MAIIICRSILAISGYEWTRIWRTNLLNHAFYIFGYTTENQKLTNLAICYYNASSIWQMKDTKGKVTLLAL